MHKILKGLAAAVACVAMPTLAQAPVPGTTAALGQRIGHTDPSGYRRSRSHGSEGDMACMTLVPRNAIPLLNFVHRCQMTRRTAASAITSTTRTKRCS